MTAVRKFPVLLWLLIAAVTGALLVATFPEVANHFAWMLFTVAVSCAVAVIVCATVRR